METDDEVRGVQHLLVEMGRLSELVNGVLRDTVGEELASSAVVATIIQLDLEGPQRPNVLMEVTGLSSGGVTRLLDRLERSGMVTRSYGTLADDRRGTQVKLTAKGRRTSRRMAVALLDRMDDITVMLKELGAH